LPKFATIFQYFCLLSLTVVFPDGHSFMTQKETCSPAFV